MNDSSEPGVDTDTDESSPRRPRARIPVAVPRRPRPWWVSWLVIAGLLFAVFWGWRTMRNAHQVITPDQAAATVTNPAWLGADWLPVSGGDFPKDQIPRQIGPDGCQTDSPLLQTEAAAQGVYLHFSQVEVREVAYVFSSNAAAEDAELAMRAAEDRIGGCRRTAGSVPSAVTPVTVGDGGFMTHTSSGYSGLFRYRNTLVTMTVDVDDAATATAALENASKYLTYRFPD